MSRSWITSDKPPGNECIRLRTARIRPQSESVDRQLTIRTPFSIEIEYDAQFNSDTFFVGARLRTIYGDIIFGSACTPIQIGPGTYRSECFVPGDLLNDGLYVIDITFARDSAIQLFRAEELLTFEIHDVERATGAWLGKIPGAIRPRLNWETKVSAFLV